MKLDDMPLLVNTKTQERVRCSTDLKGKLLLKRYPDGSHVFMDAEDMVQSLPLLEACYEERAALALWRRGFRFGTGGSIASAFPKTYEGKMVGGAIAESEDWDTYRLRYDPDGKNMRYEKIP